jgi:hypothetical protein
MGEMQRVVHCRSAEPHDTHTWQGGTVDQGTALCPGGPWTGPGSTNRGAAGDQVVLDLLAAQWRKRRLAERRPGPAEAGWGGDDGGGVAGRCAAATGPRRLAARDHLMPRRVRINGQWYDASNAPPWFEDIRPHVDNARTDREQWLATRREAAANGQRNRRGSAITGAILIGLAVGILVITGILLAEVLF